MNCLLKVTQNYCNLLERGVIFTFPFSKCHAVFPGRGEIYTDLNSKEIRNYSDICVHMSSLISKESSTFSMVLGHNNLIKGKCSSPSISAQPSLGKSSALSKAFT